MRLTHLGHACLLVEAGGQRLLIDPGTFSPGFETLTGLDAVLVTHSHPDHLDPERLPALLAANPQARVLAEAQTVAESADLDRAEVVRAGSAVTLGELDIRAVGGTHAHNHDKLPPLGNVGYVIQAAGTTLFHPGDAYDVAPPGVDVLALPLNAPWARLSQTLAFAEAVDPRVILPIHDGLLNDDGRSVYLMHVRRFGPSRSEVVDLGHGDTYDG